MVLIVCWTFGTINRFYKFLEPDNPDLTLTILHVSLGSLQGLLNAIIYGISGPVKAHIIKSCCPCLAPYTPKKKAIDVPEEEISIEVPKFSSTADLEEVKI
jgi:hypothetical protein